MYVHTFGKGPFDLSEITDLFDQYQAQHKDEVLEMLLPWIEDAEKQRPVTLKSADELDLANYKDAVRLAITAGIQIGNIIPVSIEEALCPPWMTRKSWSDAMNELKHRSYIHNKCRLDVDHVRYDSDERCWSLWPTGVLADIFEHSLDVRLSKVFVENRLQNGLFYECPKNVRDLAWHAIRHAFFGDTVRFAKFSRLLELQHDAIGLHFTDENDLAVLTG